MDALRFFLQSHMQFWNKMVIGIGTCCWLSLDFTKACILRRWVKGCLITLKAAQTSSWEWQRSSIILSVAKLRWHHLPIVISSQKKPSRRKILANLKSRCMGSLGQLHCPWQFAALARLIGARTAYVDSLLIFSSILAADVKMPLSVVVNTFYWCKEYWLFLVVLDAGVYDVLKLRLHYFG